MYNYLEIHIIFCIYHYNEYDIYHKLLIDRLLSVGLSVHLISGDNWNLKFHLWMYGLTDIYGQRWVTNFFLLKLVIKYILYMHTVVRLKIATKLICLLANTFCVYIDRMASTQTSMWGHWLWIHAYILRNEIAISESQSIA